MTRRLIPTALLVLVSLPLAEYGSSRFSWVAGPVAAVAVWLLDRSARKPVGVARRPVTPPGVLSHRREPAAGA